MRAVYIRSFSPPTPPVVNWDGCGRECRNDICLSLHRPPLAEQRARRKKPRNRESHETNEVEVGVASPPVGNNGSGWVYSSLPLRLTRAWVGVRERSPLGLSQTKDETIGALHCGYPCSETISLAVSVLDIAPQHEFVFFSDGRITF